MGARWGFHGDKRVTRCALCPGLIKPSDEPELIGTPGEGDARLICSECSERQKENKQLTDF